MVMDKWIKIIKKFIPIIEKKQISQKETDYQKFINPKMPLSRNFGNLFFLEN